MTRFWIIFLLLGAAPFWVTACSNSKKSRRKSQADVNDPNDQATTDKIPPNTIPSPKKTNDPHVDMVVETRLRQSTIGRLLLADQPGETLSDWNTITPNSIPEWIALIGGGMGSVNGVLVPFSLAPQFTSLEFPRVVLTAPKGSPTRGRIFLGIIPNGEDTVVEFISWNPVRRAFDFGFIEREDGANKLSLAHEPTCFSCHRTRSPIFPEEFWDNTVLNRSVLAAFIETQAELGTPGFVELDRSLQKMLVKNTAAHKADPPRSGEFINYQLQDSELMNAATYAGFPFVDADDAQQAFDFDGAIFEAHSMVVATDWLETLPNQDDAAKIANDSQLDLVEKYPEHYKSLASYRSPVLKNFNIMVGKENVFDSLKEVVPFRKNVNAVKEYNANAKAKQNQLLPDQYRATSATAFKENKRLPEWFSFLSESVLDRTFKESDPAFQPGEYYKPHNSEVRIEFEDLCQSCHNGASSSPEPDFSGFNPLSEGEWTNRLAEERDFKSVEQQLCNALSRIESTNAPMPPEESDAARSFVTYKSSVILSLRTLKERHKIKCLD